MRNNIDISMQKLNPETFMNIEKLGNKQTLTVYERARTLICLLPI